MTEIWQAQAEGATVTPGDDTLVSVPSGQVVMLEDVIWNVPGPDGLAIRFRFLAPQIARDGGSIDADTASMDMQALCRSFALPRISDQGPQPGQIIISLSDRPVKFGDTDPEATQFFEAYSIENGDCIWSIF